MKNLKLILFICLFLSCVIKNIVFTNIVSLFFIIIYTFTFYCQSRFMFLYSYIIFTIFRNFLSLFIIENFSIFLKDSNCFSYFKGSINEYMILAMIILEIILFFYKKFEFQENNKFLTNKKYYLFLILMIFSNIYVFGIRFKYGFIHRVEFYDTYLGANIFLHFIQIIIMFIPVYTGMLFKKEKIKSLLLLITLILYSYLIGEKFGYFYIILCFFLLGISFTANNEECKKIWKYIIIFCCLIVTICLSTFSTMYKISLPQAKKYFIQRAAQDNETWWFFYDKKIENLNIREEIKSSKYHGIADLYKIGYRNARKFGSHMLAEKMKSYEIVEGEYTRKRRIASGSFIQLKIYGRQYYLILGVYLIFSHLTLKKLFKITSRKSKYFFINILIVIYSAILLRFFLLIKTGLFQINNDFFNLKMLYFLILIFSIEIVLKIFKRRN